MSGFVQAWGARENGAFIDVSQISLSSPLHASSRRTHETLRHAQLKRNVHLSKRHETKDTTMELLIKTPIADHNDKLDVLEAMIDRSTLGGVLDLIAEVCSAKADHILTNWQDEATSDQWDRYSAALLGLQDKIARGKI